MKKDLKWNVNIWVESFNLILMSLLIIMIKFIGKNQPQPLGADEYK
jgi:hypothetical protein